MHMAVFVCFCLIGGEAGVLHGHNGASVLEALDWIREGLHPRHTGEPTGHNRELGIKRQIPKAKKEARREGAAPEQR